MAKFPKIIGISLFVLNFIIIVSIVKRCQSEHDKLEIAEHNIEALQDSVRLHKDCYNNIFYEKMTLLSTQKELEKLNKELSDNMKSLKWKYDIIAGLNSTVVVRDTIYYPSDDLQAIDLSKDIDTNHILVFTDSCIRAEIQARYFNNILSFDQFNYSVFIPIEAYFTADYRIILRSPNQKVSFSDIQSFIDPSVLMKNKRKRWSFGLQCGLGGMTGYDILNKKASITIGPYIGFGIELKLFEW